MRAAFAAALAAASLLASGLRAADVPQSGDTSVQTLATADGPAYATATQIGSAFRLRLGLSTLAAGTEAKTNLGQRRLRLERATLDYFPFANGFRLSIGARKDKSTKLGLSSFTQRGEKMAAGEFGMSGSKRRLLPGVGLGYDEMLDANTRLSFDGGMRMARRMSATSQLLRLADKSTPGGLGTRKSGFGPVARVSFIHSF